MSLLLLTEMKKKTLMNIHKMEYLNCYSAIIKKETLQVCVTFAESNQHDSLSAITCNTEDGPD